MKQAKCTTDMAEHPAVDSSAGGLARSSHQASSQGCDDAPLKQRLSERSGLGTENATNRAAISWTLTCLLVVLAAAFACPAGADTLTVYAIDGQTGQPLDGAFVMVGPAAGTPFVGNIGWTDPSGMIEFDDPSLNEPQTVTVALEGLAHTTAYESALGEITLPLYPTVPDSTMGGTITHVEGEVENISTSNNDGNLDFAFILPAMQVSDYGLGDRLPFSAGMEIVDFPVVGPVEVPENLYMPDQVEYYFLHFVKTPWRIDIPGLCNVTFVSVAGRVALDDLLSGSLELEDIEMREVGVERDVYVAGPMNLDINSDLNLSISLTTIFDDVPPGSDIAAISGARIPSGESELLVSYGAVATSIDSASIFEMPTRAPGGDLSDAINTVIGQYSDSSVAGVFGAGIIEREGFLPPHTQHLDSWMKIPELAQLDRRLSWDDPTQPGVSPSPTWTRSLIGLRPIDPEDEEVPVSVTWRLYARADAWELTLPILPAQAPGPEGGIPDPAQTPEDDQLYWSLWAANPPDDPGAVAAGFLEGATHWTRRWMALDAPASGVAENLWPRGARERLHRMSVAPNPSPGAVSLSWPPDFEGRGILEITGPDGRLVLRREVGLSPSGLCWNGHGGTGGMVASGIYWATLCREGVILARAPIAVVR